MGTSALQELYCANTLARYHPDDPHLIMGLAEYLSLTPEEIAQYTEDDRRQIRRWQARFRLHPCLRDWYQFRSRGMLKWRTVPPKEYRMGLIRVYHDTMGHAGARSVARELSRSFAWRNMRADIYAYIKGCDACQKQTPLPVRMELPHLFDLLGPFMHVCMDYCGPFTVKPYLNAAGGHSDKAWIAVIVDYFTKVAEFVVVRDKTADTAAEVAFNHWLARYPTPVKWTTDQGTEFGATFSNLLGRYNIQHVNCGVLNPKANGAAERLVQSLKRMLRKWVKDHTLHWERMLPMVYAAYMRHPHHSTGFAPAEFLFTSRPEALLPLGKELTPYLAYVEHAATSSEKYAARHTLSDYDELREKIFQSAYDNLDTAQHKHRARYIQQALRKAGRHTYDVRAGDYVLLAADNAAGLKPFFAGPYLVRHVTSYGNVTIEEAVTGTMRDAPRSWTVNPRRLIPYRTTPVPPHIDWLPSANIDLLQLEHLYNDTSNLPQRSSLRRSTATAAAVTQPQQLQQQ